MVESGILLKFRDDLAVSEQTTDGDTFCVVKDPITQRYFRLRPPEFYLLQQFDGHTAPEEIARRVNEKFGTDLSTEAVEKFAETIDSYFFFEGTRSEYEISSGRYFGQKRRSFISRLLFIKLKAFNPGPLLALLLPLARPLYNPAMVILMILFTLAGFAIYSANYEFFRFTSDQLFNVGSILIIIFSLALVIFIHEFAHALTCRYFGGQVHEMGFLLLYFQVCFYSNLSDSWMFQKKSQRLAVIWAGLFFQMVIFALAVFGWRLTVIDSAPNIFFWLTANVCLVALLFNLNPLIKLDGYYLLSEMVNIPNLRDKSFAYLKGRTLRSMGVSEPEPSYDRRQKRIFVWYTLLAGLYSIILIGYLMIIAYRFLVDNLAGFGFALFLILLAAMFGEPLLRAVRYFSQRAIMVTILTKPRNLIAGGGIILFLVIILFLIPFTRRVGSDVTILPIAEYTILLPPGLGRLEMNYREGGLTRNHSTEQIQLSTDAFSVMRLTPLVREGESVAKGDTIAAIVSNQVSSSLIAARSELERLRGELALAQSPPKPEQVSAAEAAVRASDASLDKLNKDIERNESLFQKNLISRQELDNSQAQRDIAKSNLEESQARLRLVKAPPKPAEVEIIKSKMATQEATINYMTSQAAAQVLTSPIGGMVTAVYRDSLLFKVADLSRVEVAIAVPDNYLEYVEPSAEVRLKARSFPGRLFYGKVTHIASSAAAPDAHGSHASFLVYAAIENSELLLKDGMSGYAKISSGRATLWRLLWDRVKSLIRVEFWSWW